MKRVTKKLLVIMWFHLSCVDAIMEGHIVGGNETHVSEYPHSAFLNIQSETAGNWICGSAILNQRMLITAAHCVEGSDWKNDLKSKIVAFVGNADLREVSLKRRILDVRMHKEFDDENMENDIAVAVVRKDIPLGPNVKRVVITKEYPKMASYGFVAGWGVVREDIEVTSMILKYVCQKVRSPATCTLIGQLHEGMFCAGSKEKGSSHPAKGDSGSAMVTRTGYHQIGLVSFSIKKYPGLMVYTNVTYYYDWVLDNSRDVFCSNQK